MSLGKKVIKSKVTKNIKKVIKNEKKIRNTDPIILKKAIDMIVDFKLFCFENNLGDMLYNEEYKEVEMSIILNHLHNQGQGADALKDNKKCEYKTMRGTKGSFQYHWISLDKITELKDTPHHYFGIYNEDTNLLEKIYYLPLEKIYDQLYEKYEEGEKKRLTLNEEKFIGAHKSFSLNKIIELGAEIVYLKKEV